jgi:hypothetical protein
MDSTAARLRAETAGVVDGMRITVSFGRCDPPLPVAAPVIVDLIPGLARSHEVEHPAGADRLCGSLGGDIVDAAPYDQLADRLADLDADRTNGMGKENDETETFIPKPSKARLLESQQTRQRGPSTRAR